MKCACRATRIETGTEWVQRHASMVPRFAFTHPSFGRRVPALIGLLVFLVIPVFAQFARSANAMPLRPASFGTVISGGLGIYNLTIDRTENQPFSVATGFVQTDAPGGFDITANMIGGSSPAAHITGYSYPSAVWPAQINAARAFVNYSMQVNAAPAFSAEIANLRVPVSVVGILSTSMELLPTTSVISGFAEAYATITGPGISISEGSSSTLNSSSGPLEHTTPFSASLSLFAGQVVNISLLARGKGTGAVFNAHADPVFEIDPTATFDFEGQAVRFADAFSIEFSPGIVPVPEPSAALLVGLGLGLLARSRSLSGTRSMVMPKASDTPGRRSSAGRSRCVSSGASRI